MSSDSPSRDLLLRAIRSRSTRQRSVLVFRGTGLNCWLYYPFLSAFSLEQLSDFRAIYGVSGGAVAVWFYVLAKQGMFEERTVDKFDSLMRAHMNRYGLPTRVLRLLTGKFPYHVQDNVRLLEDMVDVNAVGHTYATFPLPNFRLVGHDEGTNRVVVIDAESHPDLPVLETLASVLTPGRLAGRPFCERIETGGLVLSDLNFAGARTRRAFRRMLTSAHDECQIFHINAIRDEVRGNDRLVRVGDDRHPKLRQLRDLLAVLLGIPNRGYQGSFSKRLKWQPQFDR